MGSNREVALATRGFALNYSGGNWQRKFQREGKEINVAQKFQRA